MIRRAALALLLAVVPAPPALAATGGTTAPPAGPAPVIGGPNGGTPAGAPQAAPAPAKPQPRRPSRPKPRSRRRPPPRPPVVSQLSLSASRVYAYGAPLGVRFRIDGSRRSLPVSLLLYTPGGRRVQTISLGTLTTGASHGATVAAAGLPEGQLVLRLVAPHLRRGPHAATTAQVAFLGHHFPLAGPYTYPPGGGFGAARSGHIHQGQDLSAAEGTPILAPRGGVVTQVAYQAGGAGYYVVIAGAGEPYSYVFMHLEAASTLVHAGQTVATGQRIGLVGQTGDATGPHLHFEIWSGPWQTGGQPLDPLAFLQSWAAAAAT